MQHNALQRKITQHDALQHKTPQHTATRKSDTQGTQNMDFWILMVESWILFLNLLFWGFRPTCVSDRLPSSDYVDNYLYVQAHLSRTEFKALDMCALVNKRIIQQCRTHYGISGFYILCTRARHTKRSSDAFDLQTSCLRVYMSYLKLKQCLALALGIPKHMFILVATICACISSFRVHVWSCAWLTTFLFS